MKMTFNELPAFSRDFKRLAKKYKSLPADLEDFIRVVTAVPLGNSKHFSVLGKKERSAVVKARFFCRYLKGSSLRIIYGYRENQASIDFIEMYFKGDKECEDRGRIVEYLSSDPA